MDGSMVPMTTEQILTEFIRVGGQVNEILDSRELIAAVQQGLSLDGQPNNSDDVKNFLIKFQN
jgi:hypothetical protein